MRNLILSAAALALSGATPAAAQMAPIEWSIERGGRGLGVDEVQLTIESRWGANDRSTWSNSYSLAELPGLAPAQLAGRSAPVRFALMREPGRLDCAGTAGHWRGSGTCSFTANPAFSSYLEARGIGRPDQRESFSLALSRVGRDLVDSLTAIRPVRTNVDQLVAMGIHGVSGEFVRGFAGSGYPLKSADDLVALKIHGADLQWIQGMGAVAPQLRHLSAADLVSMRIHGVTPAWVAEMVAIGPGFRSLTGSDLVSMRIHEAKPEMVRAYSRYMGGQLRADGVVSMAIHGVTAEYIERLAALGYRNLTADELVSMRIHGVTPDFVAELQREGMARLDADQLVRLRLAGFRPRRR